MGSGVKVCPFWFQVSGVQVGIQILTFASGEGIESPTRPGSEMQGLSHSS